jgi:hypothetical protein
MKTKKLLLILALSASSYLHAQLPTYVPKNGLISWYSFDGNTNDLSGNGKNGLNYGATLTADRNNNFGKAYNFDGVSAYMKIQNSDSIVFQNGITFSAWIMPTNYKNASIVDRMTNSGNSFRISTRDNSNNAITPTKIWAQGGNYVDGTIKANSSTNIQLNDWQFVVGSYGNDDTIRIYINGILEDKVFIKGHILNQYTSIFIGKGTTSSNYELFSGAIDDIGIWSRALTPSEVNQLFISSISNIDKIKENSYFHIYPNPSSGQINLQTNMKVIGSTYTITDLTGNIVSTGKLSNDNPHIEIDNLSKGIYLLNFNEITKKSYKIVKN